MVLRGGGKIVFAFLDVSDHLEAKKKKIEFDPRRASLFYINDSATLLFLVNIMI